MLRWFRGDRDIPGLGRDHRISRATAYRYVDEGVDILADQAPDLHDALDRARADGHTHLIMDGTLLSADRNAEQTLSVKGEPIDLWYSGKTHHPAGSVQALSAPNSLPLWVSDVEPGLRPRPHRRPHPPARRPLQSRGRWTAHPRRELPSREG
ncbi:transposase family protein [Actinomadura rayongensis]|uniref:IS5/IS1182 family transposase n=1 Tax=Actinomadura rayongensis TaxID=1429076 RepID=A0A6I4W8S5_9ACTN|nr:transposase family protein [Actinomadura rayongensis]MXQ65583.1 hypothetical protein [Actinomadura rayongensis]